jgi:predicted ATPase
LPFVAEQEDSDSKINLILKEIIFISATRNGTLDVYPIPNSPFPIHADVGECGQFAPWWFAKFLDENIPDKKRNNNDSAQSLRRQFNAWANELFPGTEASVEELERLPLVKLELRTSKQQQFKRPANVGYGLTYAFPILVAGLLAKEGQVLIVDSPEAHLHPLGQSKIGYFLGTMAAAGVQVICETHSDHVLNGIRLAVADNTLLNSDVAIHFFQPQTGETEETPLITSPQIDSKGSLDIWPEGFFDQTDKDLAKLNGWT